MDPLQNPHYELIMDRHYEAHYEAPLWSPLQSLVDLFVMELYNGNTL